MGKGHDKVSNEKVIADDFGMTLKGIQGLLLQYYVVKEMPLHDWEATNIVLDFTRALSATVLSKESRLSIALVYGLQLSPKEAAIMTKIPMPKLEAAIIDAGNVLYAVLHGFKTSFKPFTLSKATTIEEWLTEVEDGTVLPFDPPRLVEKEVLERTADFELNKLARKKKEASQELPAAIEAHTQTPERKQEIIGTHNRYGLKPYDPVVYKFKETSRLVEDPLRKGEYKNSTESGVDQFRDEDYRKDVTHKSSIDRLSSGLQVIGSKKSKGDTDNTDYETGKRQVYSVRK